jgi:hypothetical protein
MHATTRIVSIAAALPILGAFAMMSPAPGLKGAEDHLSGLRARITLSDGTVRMATLQGLGCTSSICSRVAIKGLVNGDSPARFWLDSIAAIKDVRPNDAVLVMKDGTEHRMTLIWDFRVLYLGNSVIPERLDLAKTKSLQFLPSMK